MSRENSPRAKTPAAASGTRKYTQKERARQQEETRRRIVEAVAELHRTVGPAYTTISDVANLAGVGRMTVYKHFPDEADLFAACSAHWSDSHPLPAFEDCLHEKDLEARCLAVFTRLYKFFRSGHDMLGNIMRDAPSMPVLQQVLEESWNPAMAELEENLVPSGLSASTRRNVRVAIRLALDVTNWETMIDAGLSDTQAARLAARMVSAGGSIAPGR